VGRPEGRHRRRQDLNDKGTVWNWSGAELDALGAAGVLEGASPWRDLIRLRTFPEDESALGCAGDHAIGSRTGVGRLPHNVTPLAAASALALLLAGCFGPETPAGHAAENARAMREPR
jgi:hypothetical protein